jgi:hypothetical protein
VKDKKEGSGKRKKSVKILENPAGGSSGKENNSLNG